MTGACAVVMPASLQQEAEFRCTRDGVAGTNNFAGLRVRGPFDRGRAQHALDGLVERHESLRTALRAEGASVVQVIEPAARVTFEHVDAGRARVLTTAVRRMLDAPFRLTEAPLLRATVIALGPRDHVLGWAVPHTIWDAGAHAAFLADFVELYRTRRPPPPTQFGDVAAFERAHRDARAEAYWDARLRGASGRLALPLRRDVDYVPAAVWIPEVGAGLARRLAGLASECAVPLGTAVSAAVTAVLQAHAVRDDLTLAVAHAHRDQRERQTVVGCLYDFVPIRLTAPRGATFRALVMSAGDVMRDAHAHRLPGVRLLARLHEPCDVALNFQYALPPAITVIADEALRIHDYTPPRAWAYFPQRGVWWGAQVDICLVAARAGALRGYLTYNAAALSPAFAAGLAARLARGLRRLALAPDRVVCQGHRSGVEDP